MYRKNILPLLACLFASLIASPVWLETYSLSGGDLAAIRPLPGAPIVPYHEVDFDQDGSPEILTLAGGKAAIFSGEGVSWQSLPGWDVRQAMLSDLDNDGEPEASLLVWRPFKPWPVDKWLPHGGRIDEFHDITGMSCHLVLISWQDGYFRERWAGSALADPLQSFTAADLDRDGRQELLTLEGRYDDPPGVPASSFKIWEWNGFGFTLVHELIGRFASFQVVQTAESRHYVLLERVVLPVFSHQTRRLP